MTIVKDITVNTPDAICPHCDANLNGAAAANGKRIVPKENDVTMCVHCLEFAVYTKDLQLRKPRKDEVGLSDAEVALAKAIAEAMHQVLADPANG